MGRYQKVGPLDSDQERFTMLDRRIEGDQLPHCREHGLAVLAYSPLEHGLLTGKVGPDREFPEGDLRRSEEGFRVENRRRIAKMIDRLKPAAERHGITLPQLVIAWTVQQPGVTHALVGARNPTQAEENAGAGVIELTGEDLRRINEAVGECPAPRL
jgi:methylglyoxal reductase